MACVLLAAGAARGAPPDGDRRPWQCAAGRGAAFAPAGLWSDDTRGRGGKLGRTLLHRSDYANAALYAGTVLGLRVGMDPPNDPKWTGSAGFEDDARDALVGGSKSSRSGAATASDVLLALTASAPFWLDAGVGSWLRRGDCDTAVDLLGEAAEAVTLTLLITEATKLIAARERPFQRECGLDPFYDDDCFEETSRKSFWSGHASTAAVGAGLLCRNTYRRDEPLWGNLGSIRNPIPCALGVGAALATGLLRIRADEHWLGDVLAGWAVGFTLGLFDLPGPFDLLKFRYRTHAGEIEGAFLPSVGPGSIGARLVMRF